MGVFSKILDKLGIKDKEERAAAKAAKAAAKTPAKPAVKPTIPKTTTLKSGSPVVKDSRPVIGHAGTAGTSFHLDAFKPGAPAAVPMVDVVAKLEKLAAENTEKLNWKTSIVDLMKLLGLDSSLSERKALAVELGCPAEKMADSAEMNVWLHKTVLQKIAANGGNIPKELLD
ncbi:MAG TPA: DUF3597 domain-containing protein [Anaerolineaceae bacterium]|nr:DUF3597 domain-containing protein [Anaerolineaceae bacterium]